uniref:protein-glutamine gamma-glutamyltransferase n=2 Tax=Cacopsylla melanoneura TaxID=428564 RepID=A0A8D9BVS8_9HEMI
MCDQCDMTDTWNNWVNRVRELWNPNLYRHAGNARGIRRIGSLPKPPLSHDNRHVDEERNEVDGHTEILRIKAVDLCLEENGRDHSTQEYELMRRNKGARLVVRRGQAFRLKLTLSRRYYRDRDAISFVFMVAGVEKPSYGHGTLVVTPLLPENAESQDIWGASLVDAYDNVVIVQILTDPECIVGEWNFEIDTKLMNDGALSYSHPDPFIVLFNPWCPDDDVYLESEEERKEYVLSDTGLLYRGSYNRMRPAVWKYSQYEKDVLECSLYLSHTVGEVGHHGTNDAVQVARALSAAVNSPDDYGAVFGNWSTDFSGGTPPTKWVGSMKILQQFYNKKKPVKYGQCWVFSGVLTTVCRALGIPCRNVTCYAAAHDTQNSLTVDYFVDEDGRVMEELNSDSIWNFHMWNEVWMTRRDLGTTDFNGWQVIDATPQELSGRKYQCGPTSVVAVKRGEVKIAYDGGFVFSEVNADKVFWRYNGPTQPLKLLRKDVNGIGLALSTKAVGSWTRQDITENYKYDEKSSEERSSMLKALKQSASIFSRYYLNEEFNDIKFDFELRDDIVIGSPFSVVVKMSNKSRDQDYTVTVILRVDAVTYTGKVGDSVKKTKEEVVVRRGKTEEIVLHVSYEEYYKRLVDQADFNIACLATVHDTNFEYFAQDDFRVRKPDIKIKIVAGEPVVGQEMTVSASLTNPLPVPLKNGQFRIEGPGLDKQLKIKLAETIAPKEEAKVKFQLSPKFEGKHSVVAKFLSKELTDVDGLLEFMVIDKATLSNIIPTR